MLGYRVMRGLRGRWCIIGTVALASCTGLLGIDRDYTESAASAGDSAPSHAIIRRPAISAGSVSAASQAAQASITAGDLLVVAVYWAQHTASVQVTDTLGNRWTHLSAQNACAISMVQIWYAEGAAGGSDTITVTQDSTDKLGFFLLAYGGIMPAGSFDAANEQSASSAGSNAMQVGPLVTSGSLDVIIAIFADTRVSSGLMGTGAGFTREGADQGFISLVEDNAVAPVPPGSYYATAALPASTSDICWSAVAAAFKAQ
jgi:hypothetical protein